MPTPMENTATSTEAPESQKGFARRLDGRIMVVDDEMPNRLYLRKLLASRGCSVCEAADGPSALKLAREQKPELILADVMMPGMDGFELCRLLKQDSVTHSIPVILVTAKSKIDDIETGFLQGAMDYIRKPFNPRELLLRVGNALDLKRSNEVLTRWKSRLTHELELAGAMQRSIFSESPLFTDHFEIRIAYRPCMDVGGDIFDIIQLPNGGLCAYIGDVSGHGVAPAMISSFLKATIGELVRQQPTAGPAEICNLLHDRFLQTVGKASYYATFFMAIFDPQTKRWRCMNCGHPNPIIMKDGQSVSEGLFSLGGGVPIGFAMAGNSPYCADDEVYLSGTPGSYFVMYTDGIIEARQAETQEDCGPETFIEVVRNVVKGDRPFNKSGAILDQLTDRGYLLNEDDCTAISIYMNSPEDVLMDGVVSGTLEAVSDMALQVEEVLLNAKWPESAAAGARLIAIEHGANVVEHGGISEKDTFRVQILACHTLCKVVFTDNGREWDLKTAERKGIKDGDLSEGGRGVAIINALSDYRERYRADNKNVSFYVLNKSMDW